MFNKRLTDLRENRDLTKRIIAKYFGVNETTYGKWENGSRTPDIFTIKKLANYFDVSIDYLLDNEKIQSPKSRESIEINRAMEKVDSNTRSRMLEMMKLAFPEAFNINAIHPTGYSSDLKAFTEVTGARTYLAQQQWSAEDGRTTDQLTDDEATARATTIYNNNLKNTK